MNNIILICLIISLLMVFLIIMTLLNDNDLETNYYDYIIKYREDYEKYIIMLKKQKKIILKKKLELIFLKILYLLKWWY